MGFDIDRILRDDAQVAMPMRVLYSTEGISHFDLLANIMPREIE